MNVVVICRYTPINGIYGIQYKWILIIITTINIYIYIYIYIQQI